jgi:hypothetical protein
MDLLIVISEVKNKFLVLAYKLKENLMEFLETVGAIVLTTIAPTFIVFSGLLLGVKIYCKYNNCQ